MDEDEVLRLSSGLSENEFISHLVKYASKFVEDFDEFMFKYYARRGYNMNKPKRFHAGVADKYIFRRLMVEAVKEMTPDFFTEYNAEIISQRVLFNQFYLDYSL